MRNITALEIDLAKARNEFNQLRKRADKFASGNYLSTEMNKVGRRITNLQININQRKQYELQQKVGQS
jgi:hypothetical protein